LCSIGVVVVGFGVDGHLLQGPRTRPLALFLIILFINHLLIINLFINIVGRELNVDVNPIDVV